MHLNGTESILWYCDLALDCVLCWLVFWRHLHRCLPVFTGYIVLLLGRAVFLYWVYNEIGYTSRAAFYSFWVTEAVLVVVRGLAIGELAWSASRPYPGFRAVLKWTLSGMAGFFLLFTAVIALTNVRRLPPLILGLERNLNLTAAVLLLVLFGLSRVYEVVLDFPRKLIALGFFLYSTLQIAGNAVSVELLRSYFHDWNLVRIASFQVAQALWIFALSRPLPSFPTAPTPPNDIETLREILREGNRLLRHLSDLLSQIRKSRTR